MVTMKAWIILTKNERSLAYRQVSSPPGKVTTHPQENETRETNMILVVSSFLRSKFKNSTEDVYRNTKKMFLNVNRAYPACRITLSNMAMDQCR